MKSSRSNIYNALMVTIISLLLVTIPVSTALAFSTGPNNAGTGTNETGIGTIAWQNTDNITASDTAKATAVLSKSNLVSNYLQGTDYGFTIPLSATIQGIEVVINRQSDFHNPSILDNVVSLVKGATIVGANRASLTVWPTSMGTATYGGATDLWDETWTPADINSSDFGVVLSALRQNNGNNNRTASVDFMQISVYYTLGTTSTTVDCGAGTPITYGDSITCIVTVSDAGYLTPTGTVSWSTDGSGTFDPTPCNLTEATVGTATCSVDYTPSAFGTSSHLITANYSGDTYYSSGSGTDTVTVNKKPASVTPNAASKTYSDVDPALSGTLSGFLVADGVTATYSRTAGETVLGSPYTISATLSPTEVLVNYDITYNTANFTINPKPASVTPNAASKIYGDVDPALSGTLSGFLVADGVTATYSRTAGETVLGSPYTISATLSPTEVLGNYDITYNTGNFTINPKPASVTPNAASKIYGDPDPVFTGTLSGFLIADGLAATYSRNTGETVAGSQYTISATLTPTAVLSNYDITYNNANFTITKRPITVTADAKTKFPGQPDPALTYQITSGSLAFSDAFSGELIREPGEGVGTYAILQGSLAINVNYTLTYVDANLTITNLIYYFPLLFR